MKRYYLLKLSPCGNNQVLNEIELGSYAEAVEFFNKYNSLALNAHGYVKYGEISYCIATQYPN